MKAESMDTTTSDLATDEQPNAEDTELALLRAKRAEAAKRREAREAELGASSEIERERRALADELALGEAVEKYGMIDVAIKVVETSLGNVIVKRSEPLKFRRFQDSDKTDYNTCMSLVSPCLVHPSETELETMLKLQPAIAYRCAVAITRLAGVRADDVGKK